MPRKLATQCTVVWGGAGAGLKSRRAHLAGGENMEGKKCKAPRPVAPPQRVQRPAAKMLDQKGNTAFSLDSRRELFLLQVIPPKFTIHNVCARVW